MNKYIPTYPYGAIIVFAGVFLLFSAYLSFNAIKLTLGISLIIGAIFSFISALSSRKSKVAFAYQEMHALAMFVYGVSVLLFCNSIETLTSVTAFLFIFYSFSEIIFCLRVFDLQSTVVYKIALIRLLLGLVIGVGTIIAMNFSKFTLEGFGILFIMVGINVILYLPIMKIKEFSEA